jgi:hypothetical protein
MNLDDTDLTPSGADLLPRPVTSGGQQVATFTPTRHVNPSEAWQPFTRPTSMTSDGTQGSPYGSLRSALRPGGSIRDEPVDGAEREAQKTAQTASHLVAGQQVRSALRGV